MPSPTNTLPSSGTVLAPYGSIMCVTTSVADPDPPDPHVLGPPGPGSTCQDPDPEQDPDPDPSIIMQK